MEESSGGASKWSRRIRRVASSLWVLWLLMALCSLATFYGAGERDTWNYVINPCFDIFTPILVWNWSVLTAVVLFIGLAVGDWLTAKIKFLAVRVVCNLLILFCLTWTIDTIKWDRPVSFAKFQSRVLR